MTAHQALYGLPGSTFFAAPSQSHPLRPRARPPPPGPGPGPSPAPHAQADDGRATYSAFPEPAARLTHLPVSHSSNILVHSGFWQLLSTTGSRFLATAVPAFPDELASAGDAYAEEEGRVDYRAKTAGPGVGGKDFRVGGGGRDKVRKGMIGRPGGFT